MDNLHSPTKQPFQLLILISLAAVLSFTACSGSSKKQNNNQSPTVNKPTVNQQATNNQQAKTNKQKQSVRQKGSTQQEISQMNKNNNSGENKINTTTAANITAARGHKIAQNNGCFACHSVDGSIKAAPSFKNLYGRKVTLKNGQTLTADADYITQSIKDPTAKIVKGFSPVMPSFSYLKKDQIASIIAYIKSISK